MSKVKNIFDKLRPDRTDGKQAATVEHVAAIDHTTEAIGWRPVSYTIPNRYEQFLANLDDALNDFIAKANPDRYNAGFFEEIIENECRIALEELALQEIEHRRSIHNIEIYQEACLADLELDLQRMEEALARKKEEV